MKQFALLIECVVTEGKDTIILRDPNCGKIVKVASTPEEVLSFLNETITSVKSQISASHDKK